MSKRERIFLGCATLKRLGWWECVESWGEVRGFVKGKPIPAAYNILLKISAGFEILGLIHDDVWCEESGWRERVEREFDDPEVAIVGLGGALGHGDPNLGKVPYQLSQLARQRFRSNMRFAEAHGERFAGKCEVAVIDGFAIFVRREWLEGIGGWPEDGRVDYFMYAEWLCCMARRAGKRIRLVGVACDHLGGKSTGLGEREFDFEGEHRFIYDEFRDVLPWEVR